MDITAELKAELVQWLKTFWMTYTYIKYDVDSLSIHKKENYCISGFTQEEIKLLGYPLQRIVIRDMTPKRLRS